MVDKTTKKIGKVVKIIAGFYDIKIGQQIYRIRASGKLRDNNQTILVGDFIEFEKDLILTKVLPRRNNLIRPKVANIDQVVIVTALSEPKFSSLLLDKMLMIVESQRIKPLILFTKTDLGILEPIANYISQNYDVVGISNNDETEKITQILQQKLAGKTSVFTGQSGAGKTTTINHIMNLSLETQAISKSLGRGKHTTRVVEIYYLNNFEIIDTPGFSSLEIALTKQEISKAYSDFNFLSQWCEFRNCLHYQEKKCEIKKSVSLQKILKSRYENYLKILKEVL